MSGTLLNTEVSEATEPPPPPSQKLPPPPLEYNTTPAGEHCRPDMASARIPARVIIEPGADEEEMTLLEFWGRRDWVPENCINIFGVVRHGKFICTTSLKFNPDTRLNFPIERDYFKGIVFYKPKTEADYSAEVFPNY